jgi:WD40 repeat protein
MSVSNSARLFRLFVSSTFSDFIAEREALQKVVFPELEEYCAKHGARFQAVDLRWGITEEAQREHDTMRICLEEVRRCQDLSPRPNFAVLLGDRYGWEPVPARIPLSHWRRLLAAGNAQDRKTIRAGYDGPDRNAVPPVMHLKRREGDWGANEARENALRSALRRTADQAGFEGDDRLPYFASATHQEIALGALADRDGEGNLLHPEEHVHVYSRRIEGLPADASARAFIDWDAEIQGPTPDSRQKLAELETQLRKRLPGRVRELRARWGRDGTDHSHLDAFCAYFLADQKLIIDRELGGQRTLGEGAVREAQHRAFALERARNFVGRQPVLKRIASYLRRRGKTSPLIVHGAGGTGKSALMAEAYRRASESSSGQAVLLARFIGGVPGTESLMRLLTELTVDIQEAYGRPIAPPPEKPKAAREALAASLQEATADRPLVLFLDALDQLDPSDGAWLLDWLPKQLGAHTRVVVSTREGQALQSALRRYPKTLLEVPAMTPTEGRQMLDAWLADTREAHYNAGIASTRGRRLTRDQRTLILSAFAHVGKPLWLKFAYEEARGWASWQVPKALPVTLDAMVENLITRRLLEGESHPPVFATRALAYITAGRFGLAEEELDHALATDAAVKSEFMAQNAQTGQTWDADSKRLPPILWSRLHFDLQPYLAKAQVDGTLTFRWFHREIAEEIAKRYLASVKEREEVHGHLADTFHALAPYQDDLFRYTDASTTQQPAAVRRVMEQPWQLMHAGRVADADALLASPGFLIAKAAANRIDDLLSDFWSHPGRSSQTEVTLDFLGAAASLLKRGDRRWPAHHILLQWVLEHGDASVLTRAFEVWASRLPPEISPPHIRNRLRPVEPALNPTLFAWEAHTDRVNGTKVLDEHRLLSWGEDGAAKILNVRNRCIEASFHGHEAGINGAVILADRRFATYGDDRRVCIFSIDHPEPLAVMQLHQGTILGIESLGNDQFATYDDAGLIITWDGKSSPREMVGHLDDVVQIERLDPGLLISSASDGAVRVWDLASGSCLRTILNDPPKTGKTNPVWFKILPDKRIATYSRSGKVCILEPLSTTALAVMNHCKGVNGIAMLDHERLLSWSEDGNLYFWKFDDETLIGKCKGSGAPIENALVVEGRRIFSWTQDDSFRGELQLWDAESMALVSSPMTSADWIWDGVLLGDGSLLTWAMSGALSRWDSNTGDLMVDFKGHRQLVHGASCLRAGTILSWSADCSVRVWNPDTGAQLAHYQGPSGYMGTSSGALELADGKIVSWFEDGSVRLLREPTAGLGLPDVDTGLSAVGVEVLGDKRVVAWTKDYRILVLTPDCASELFSLRGHENEINGVQDLGDGTIISWSDDLTVRRWDLGSRREMTCLRGHSDGIFTPVILSDNRILTYSQDGTIRIWGDGDCSLLMRHDNWVVDVHEVSGKFLISRSMDERICVWNLQSGEQLASIGYGQLFGGMSVTPDHCRLVTWDYDGRLDCWDLPTGKHLFTMLGHSDGIDSAIFFPDGRILSRSWDHSMRIWDGTTGRQLAVLQGHTDSVSDALILDDGRVVSCSSDGTVRIWVPSDPDQTQTIDFRSDPAQSLKSLPNNKLVITSARDAFVFELETGRCVASLGSGECPASYLQILTEESDGLVQDGHAAWPTDYGIRWRCSSDETAQTLEWHQEKGWVEKLIHLSSDSCTVFLNHMITTIARHC